MKFKVDQNACIGCGACQAVCEEVFEITDDGYAVAKNEEIKDEEVKENAISAMEGCPTSAISEVKEAKVNNTSVKENKPTNIISEQKEDEKEAN